MTHQEQQHSEDDGNKPKDNSWTARLGRYIESRTGMTAPIVRPAPLYSMNPFYWLGALSVVAFIIQGVTGIIMLFYYSPTPDTAYSSTQYIFQKVYFGQFLETVHLYTAYAMIILVFMHMMRGYFVSVHRKPREIMWITGMIMGFVTLGFGFTGYLLPWTVVSVAASDVGVGMVGVLPPPIANLANFLLVGGSGPTSELLRFFDLHVVVLPAVLLGLLVAKMAMLETHGISEPVTGTLTERLKRTLPIFPDMTVYLVEISVVFGAGVLLFSAIFPLQLGPEYSATAAGAIAAQPDWYFLWLYQILKIDLFEKAGVAAALTVVTVILGAMTVLPWIDRGDKKRIIDRPKYVTLGAIFVAELIVLAAWGEVTPGQIISNAAAVEVLGGTALVVALAVFGVYAAIRPKALTSASGGPSISTQHPLRNSQAKWIGLTMTALMVFGALGMGVAIDSIVKLAEFGVNAAMTERLTWSLSLLAAVVALTIFTFRYVGEKIGGDRPSTRLLHRLGLN
jgi:ubiquinol-cytochrome c reductase cytochrome b subunit